MTTATWACSSKKLRQIRAACVEAGSAASVLNFVINPLTTYDLPFFGADLVTLPAGHLLALDLQPALKTDRDHTEKVWSRLLPIFERWQECLPHGGPIPEEAQPYFSPGFLWTRIPLGAEGDALINEAVMPAFKDYLSLYLELVDSAEAVEPDRSEALLAGQRRYTTYRAEKDPARGMLTRFHGSEWTEATSTACCSISIRTGLRSQASQNKAPTAMSAATSIKHCEQASSVRGVIGQNPPVTDGYAPGRPHPKVAKTSSQK